MIISFGWTSGAMVCGAKTRTRRDWAPGHVRHFHSGMMANGWSQSPRVHGVYLSDVRLTAPIFRQHTSKITDEDWELEGFGWMSRRGILINGVTPEVFFERWRHANIDLWVVDFSLEYLTKAGLDLKWELESKYESILKSELEMKYGQEDQTSVEREL